MAISACAQTGDVHQRLLRALGPEKDAQAEALLKDRRFSEVDGMVAESKTGDMLALRGALAFLSGDMGAAVKFFRQAGATAELNEPDRFTLAMALVQLGRDNEARSELTPLEEQWPRKAVYAYWLGRLDYDQRRYAEAVKQLKKATELDAKSPRAWDSLGLAYDMQGNAEEALKAFELGASSNREQPHRSPWPVHDLGALLLRTGETKKAIAAFREALEYDPQMEAAHYHLGRALEKDGANDEALQQYEIALREDVKATDVCYSLAMLYRKMGRANEAETAFAEWRRRRDAAQ